MNESTHDRLKNIMDWCHTTENQRIYLRKEDFFWLMEEKAKLDMILGLDADLGDELAAEPADLSNEEAPL